MNISNVLRNAAALGGIATLIVCGTANAATPAKAKLSAATHAVKVQQIRNATIKVNYAGTTFLIDPMLAKKGTYPGFEGRTTASCETRWSSCRCHWPRR